MSKMRFFALQELSNRKPLEVTTPSNKLSDYYASHVFDRKKMQEYLPKEAYKAVVDATEKGTPISREMADLIANGMKSWAKSLNVTHYTHWFQPLTDGTAEKHDGFIEFGEDGEVIERFSGNPNAHRGIIYCSNLCTEIAQNMSSIETVSTEICTEDGDTVVEIGRASCRERV